MRARQGANGPTVCTLLRLEQRHSLPNSKWTDIVRVKTRTVSVYPTVNDLSFSVALKFSGDREGVPFLVEISVAR